jgi:16S rRNA (guanine527-N7)-methyltransferase
VGEPKSPDAHEEALAGLGLGEGPSGGLVAYLDLLADWSRRVNLTGARSAAERVATLVAPVLPLVAFVVPGPLLDIGSGNGSPGLVLAILRPDLEITLVEPRLKRWAFLREAIRVAACRRVRVFRGRHLEWPGPPAETVLLRALALPLRELRALVRPGGRVLVLGRAPAPAPGFEAEPGPGPAVHAFRRST